MFALLKLIVMFFFVKPKLALKPNAGTSPNTKQLFLRLPAQDDKLLLTTNIITFLAGPVSKL